MNLDFNLNLTQQQKLIMTQSMQLSIKILQMSNYELKEYVDREVQENPVLDIKYDENVEMLKDNIEHKKLMEYFGPDNYGYNGSYSRDEEDVSPFNFISSKISLKEYLTQQIYEYEQKDYYKSICIYIIENLNNNGYLDEDIESMAKDLNLKVEDVEYSLRVIQALEPCGIAARNIKECLKLQLNKKGIEDENIFLIIEDYLECIAENKYNNIAKALDISIQKAQEYGDVIKNLEPKPSRGFYTGEETKYIAPDAYIKKIHGEYIILMNDGFMPKLSVNEMYQSILQNETDKDTVDYVKEKLNSAVSLLKSIESRKSTIYRVLEEILRQQKEYFQFGEIYLKPMTLNKIAEKLEVHESTISRAIRDKYIYTDRGLIKIKDLFTVGINSANNTEDVSTKNIKTAIKAIIDKENKEKPLSDQSICDELNKNDMNISRRTVAKYREELGIKGSSKRKRF